MFVVIVKEKNSDEISNVVKVLKNKGLQIGVDFDFEYTPGSWDWQTTTVIPRQTKFTFYNEEQGIIFALEYL